MNTSETNNRNFHKVKKSMINHKLNNDQSNSIIGLELNFYNVFQTSVAEDICIYEQGLYSGIYGKSNNHVIAAVPPAPLA